MLRLEESLKTLRKLDPKWIQEGLKIKVLGIGQN
jgi:hypothetical protein